MKLSLEQFHFHRIGCQATLRSLRTGFLVWLNERYSVDVHAQLKRSRQIAIIWSTDDVLAVRPDLTPDQAWEILQASQHNHDANFGVTWQSLEATADALYGLAGSTGQTGGDHD